MFSHAFLFSLLPSSLSCLFTYIISLLSPLPSALSCLFSLMSLLVSLSLSLSLSLVPSLFCLLFYLTLNVVSCLLVSVSLQSGQLGRRSRNREKRQRECYISVLVYQSWQEQQRPINLVPLTRRRLVYASHGLLPHRCSHRSLLPRSSSNQRRDCCQCWEGGLWCYLQPRLSFDYVSLSLPLPLSVSLSLIYIPFLRLTERILTCCFPVCSFKLNRI